MAIPAPNVDTTKRADRVHDVADCTSAALNLTTVADKGNFAAQMVRFFNNDTVSRSVTVTPEYGANVVIVIGAGQQYETAFPVKNIVSATGSAVVSALCMWWAGNSSAFNR